MHIVEQLVDRLVKITKLSHDENTQKLKYIVEFEKAWKDDEPDQYFPPLRYHEQSHIKGDEEFAPYDVLDSYWVELLSRRKGFLIRLNDSQRRDFWHNYMVEDLSVIKEQVKQCKQMILLMLNREA